MPLHCHSINVLVPLLVLGLSSAKADSPGANTNSPASTSLKIQPGNVSNAPVVSNVPAFSDVATADVNLQWQASGLRDKTQIYISSSITLTSEKPVGLKKAPTDLVAPLYGQITLGPKEAPATFLIIVDEPTKDSARLFIDSNSNGDLTDDPKIKWKWGGGNYMGHVDLSIPYATGPREGRLVFCRFDKNDPQRARFKDDLFYCADYGWAGKIKFGDKAVPAVLMNESDSGDFRPPAQRITMLWLDTNDDGKVTHSELYKIDKPFNIGGTTWEVADLTADGNFKVVKSSQTVAERPLSLKSGDVSPSFTAQTTDGKTVKLPDDYKGKLVLLDFWATWCGPCMEEMPNVARNYAAYHARGLEVLGISLDDAVDAHFTTVLKDKNMTWPQICDGKAWKSSVARLYGIDSIPHMILFDGDTGKILADGPRGDALGKAIEDALAQRKK